MLITWVVTCFWDWYRSNIYDTGMYSCGQVCLLCYSTLSLPSNIKEIVQHKWQQTQELAYKDREKVSQQNQTVIFSRRAIRLRNAAWEPVQQQTKTFIFRPIWSKSYKQISKCFKSQTFLNFEHTEFWNRYSTAWLSTVKICYQENFVFERKR